MSAASFFMALLVMVLLLGIPLIVPSVCFSKEIYLKVALSTLALMALFVFVVI